VVEAYKNIEQHPVQTVGELGTQQRTDGDGYESDITMIIGA
jgi:hypothetical protein